MKYIYSISVFVVLWIAPYVAIASEDCTGIWIGNVIDLIAEEPSDDFFVSVHQTDTRTVVIFLNAVEATGDLFSSTFTGESVDNLNSLGSASHFPTIQVQQDGQITGYFQGKLALPLRLRCYGADRTAYLSVNIPRDSVIDSTWWIELRTRVQ